MRFLFKISALVALSVGFPSQGFGSSNLPEPCALYGRIKFVDSNPDVRVKFVTTSPNHDLRVRIVPLHANRPGEWQEVEHFPDFRVQVVESFPDYRVKVVESFPDCKR